jgi:hypothetical protein
VKSLSLVRVGVKRALYGVSQDAAKVVFIKSIAAPFVDSRIRGQQENGSSSSDPEVRPSEESLK